MNEDTNFYVEQNKKAKLHANFHHYTNIESLAHILSNKVLRLSELKKVNDPIEEKRVDLLFKNKIYTVCFSHQEEQTISMWKMYGSDRMGICIWFSDLNFLEDKNNYIELQKGWEIRDVRLLDILYEDNLESFKTKYYPLGEDFPPHEYNTCVGFAKTKIWEYEQETRLRCYIDVAEGNPSRPIDKVKKYIGYNYPDFDYVFCRIPDEILNNIKIIFNPFMDGVQKNIVKATVKSLLPDFNDGNFMNSNLEGKIR